jgi:hypothetical protein
MIAVRRARPARRVALAVGVLASVVGCTDYEPNYLFRGQWIDIDGQGRSADETCAGTFAYVDAYAGALAAEFGVEEHVGDYRWYSQQRFDADDPCEGSSGCTYNDSTSRTPHMPDNHELVHLATFATVPEGCPKPLAEGIAEYHGSTGLNVGSSGFERLVEALDDPTADIPEGTYAILGRFVAYLVERFGHDAVLEVCRASGRSPSAAQLSATMDAVVGQSTAELLADFEPELGPECNQSKDFQSRVYACGVAGAAPDIGLVDEEGVELRYEIECANERVIGPLGGRIWIVERLDLDQDDDWVLWMSSDDADISDVTLTIAACGPCSWARVFGGEFIGPETLDAGRYWLEVNAPADFVGTVDVRIHR